jgi:ubiquinone/menaquinone biosynthesis C-methylase UbiE
MTKSIIKNILYPNSNILVGTVNEKNRLTWLEATLKTIPTGSRILDAGAGELAQKKFCSHLNYISQDFAQYDGTGDGKGLQTKNWDNSKLDIISDITSIPEPDASFDAIMCIEVFEHLPNPVLAIKEFSRLLRKDGVLIITAPFCSLTHFAPFHFSTGFNKYFYEKHLSDYGLTIIEILTNGNYFEYMAQEIRRLPEISENYSNSKLNTLDKLRLNFLLKRLQKLSKKDSGSQELLCFGYHIKAVKK